MDINLNTTLADNLSAMRQAGNVRATYNPAQARQSGDTALPVSVSRPPLNTNTPQGTRLISEDLADFGDGAYRLTRTFQRDDGRQFTKIEEFSLTDRGARKTVVQQNPSGSITRYEEVLDREAGGNFRRTQRFEDANGEIETNITGNYQVSNPFVLTGGALPPAYDAPSPFNSSRGTQLDLSA